MSNAVGTVIVNYRRHVDVETADGSVLPCVVRGRQLKPVSGDRVEYSLTQQDEGVIENILERETVLERFDSSRKRSALAANVDRVLVVVALEPMLESFTVDKYLVAVEASGAEPVIVINKVDLADEMVMDWLQEFTEEYRDIGYPSILLSTESGEGMKALEDALQNHTAVLVGPSGVGKSSIAQHLLPDNDIKVGEISAARQEGRHTTTRSTLYHLANGGRLIDSPGVREYRLWPMPVRELAGLFPEMRERANNCKFADCVHRAEPGCAVRAAVDAEEILLRRYEAYLGMAEIMDRQYKEY
ncbi:MAG: ribosome small subunit-dependent GTPase A [Gammaproteobacteria bacterium]|nr:ribosome small subunit-dependent GTPase A [Gammaproteobacteria bacterium]